MDRRTFLKQGSGALIAMKAGTSSAAEEHETRQEFKTANTRWQAAYDKAIAVLAGNVRVLSAYPKPVLIEGSVYQRLSGEGGPHEGLVYSSIRRDVARNNQMGFFAFQREDGHIPFAIMASKGPTWDHLQLAVPLVAAAWELSRKTGDSELLETAYKGWSCWDAWMSRYRNTRGTGLCEGFCTFDTGQDNSTRYPLPAPMAMQQSARHCLRCHAFVQICRPRYTVDAWHWRRWRRRLGKPPRPTAGRRALNRYEA